MSIKIRKILEMNRLENITTIVGLGGQCATYVQAYKIFYLQSSYAISFIATFISFTSMAFWLLYGIKQHSIPLIICNIFGLIGSFLILAGVLYYGYDFL